MSIAGALKRLSPLPVRLLRFYDGVTVRLELRMEKLSQPAPAYQPRSWDEIIKGTEECLSAGMNGFRDESALADIENAVVQGIQRLVSQAPFPLAHNADFTLAYLCYLVCRATKPATVLETGVAYGVTSAYILKALEVNGHGLLHSVDRPPFEPDADQFVGFLIPEALKSRWRLHRGVSRRVFPRLLPQLGPVDVFIHDSRHTYRNIDYELRAVQRHLAPRSVVMADDVDRNRAFHDWATRARPAFWATAHEPDKKGLLGVSVFLDPQASGR